MFSYSGFEVISCLICPFVRLSVTGIQSRMQLVVSPLGGVTSYDQFTVSPQHQFIAPLSSAATAADLGTRGIPGIASHAFNVQRNNMVTLQWRKIMNMQSEASNSESTCKLNINLANWHREKVGIIPPDIVVSNEFQLGRPKAGQE